MRIWRAMLILHRLFLIMQDCLFLIICRVSLRPILAGNTPDDWQDCAYHRYWMHKDDDHNAYAHYGIRTKDYKLIYWYNDALDQPGANANDDDEPPAWELFDCRADPLELNNVYYETAYQPVVSQMRAKLDAKMKQIKDWPAHEKQIR